ncbi:MAG: helix-turn-helix transcriptional regulator [Romboutsia sp.]|uniref:helix-turn-helix transcriptional regulator n=1 Tax=Romboutsia sp. TaxID=1965302 RepID=UPI003F3359AB
MKNITDTLNDFYHCCNVPILALDEKFNLIYEVGNNNSTKIIFEKFNILEDIKKNIVSNSKFNLTYENFKFIIINLTRHDNFNTYFIIGPFKCIYNDLDLIPFKPNSCINYISSTFSSIYDDKINFNLHNLKSNLHVRKAIQYIYQNYTYEISLDDICKILNINKSYFCKIFKSETKLTFSNFLNSYRVEKSKDLLIKSNMNLLDIALSVGFNNQNYYTMVFKKFTGSTPFQYRNE